MGIELWMVFEAVAESREDLEDSLDDHIEKMKTESEIEITEYEIEESEEVENPHPGLDKGFSQVAEVKAEAENYTRAVKTVINYGPTYVQVEGPDTYDMGLPDAQKSLQEVANMMHKYAQMGVGGVLVSNPEADE